MPPSYSCEMMQVMSPENDWGCVTPPTAQFLGTKGWSILDEYPERYKHYVDPEWVKYINTIESRNQPSDPPVAEKLAIELRMPKLPLVGQSADIISS